MNNETNRQPTPEQIAACAYLLWEQEGQPHGRHEIHWLEAEKQLKADGGSQDTEGLRRPAPTMDEQPRAGKSKRAEAVAR